MRTPASALERETRARESKGTETLVRSVFVRALSTRQSL